MSVLFAKTCAKCDLPQSRFIISGCLIGPSSANQSFKIGISRHSQFARSLYSKGNLDNKNKNVVRHCRLSAIKSIYSLYNNNREEKLTKMWRMCVACFVDESVI